MQQSQQLQEGESIAAIARNFNVSQQTIMRIGMPSITDAFLLYFTYLYVDRPYNREEIDRNLEF